jgi:hypothetical protein
MIVNRIDILDDDNCLDKASRLVISQADDGDFYISILTYQEDADPGFISSGTVRIRNYSGGGSHPELLKDFCSLMQRAISSASKNRNGGIVVY